VTTDTKVMLGLFSLLLGLTDYFIQPRQILRVVSGFEIMFYDLARIRKPLSSIVLWVFATNYDELQTGISMYVVSESGTKWALEKVDTLRVMPAYP